MCLMLSLASMEKLSLMVSNGSKKSDWFTLNVIDRRFGQSPFSISQMGPRLSKCFLWALEVDIYFNVVLVFTKI